MNRGLAAVLSSAPLVMTGCAEVGDLGGGLVGGGVEPPRVLTSEDGLDVVAVRGNLYEVTPGSGGGTVATAKLAPMFANGAVPNGADASTAVAHVFSERGCGFDARGALGHEVNRSANEQSWTFAGDCT